MAGVGGGTTKVNVVVNPIAPSHPIVISCINGKATHSRMMTASNEVIGRRLRPE